MNFEFYYDMFAFWHIYVTQLELQSQYQKFLLKPVWSAFIYAICMLWINNSLFSKKWKTVCEDNTSQETRFWCQQCYQISIFSIVKNFYLYMNTANFGNIWHPVKFLAICRAIWYIYFYLFRDIGSQIPQRD